MAFNLDSITAGMRLRAPRIVLLGVEKIGKSTFAAGSARPIFLPIKGEEGIDSIDVPQFPTCNTYGDVCEALRSLHGSEHEYGTVVIDSSSALEPLVHAEVCRRHKADTIEEVLGGYGKGLTIAVDVWREITEWLDALRRDRNMATILIGHVKVNRFDDPAGPSYDTYAWDVHKNASAMLFRWCDSILFASGKTVVQTEKVGFSKEKKAGIDITNGQRFLYTQKRPAHPGGGRGPYGQLPYEMSLDWGIFMEQVAIAAAK